MNVIVYNLAACSANSIDLKLINSIFDNIDNCPKAIYAVRFGTARENSPRPLKISFENKRDAQTIWRNKMRLASEFGLSVKNDFTPAQIEYAGNLFPELNKRVAEGETNLKIQYFNRLPKIVEMKKKKN